MATKTAGGRKTVAVADGPSEADAAKYAVQEEAMREVLAELHERAGDMDESGVLALGRRLLADRCPGCPELAFEFRDRNNVVRKVRIRGGR